MPFFISSDNDQKIELTQKIADSGEGTVWKTSRTGFLAKIYKQPSQERADKLSAMLDNRPSDPNSNKHHISFAWPQALLMNNTKEIVGFLMSEIVGGRELLQIYNPKRRKQLGLEVEWHFLHVVATNIAHVVMAIHERGYVIGDIKPQNILVNNQAMVSVIDTDSFQVKDISSGRIHHCLVGSSGFTPPELLGTDIATTEQNIQHDFFRLAVLIYYLLFGNPPFQGKWTRVGDSPQQDVLVKNGWWPYAPNSPIQAGPITIPLDIVDPQIKANFLKCFNDGHQNPDLRPSAESWYLALLGASGSLTECTKTKGHVYRQVANECYWCQRKALLNFDVFDLSFATNKKNLIPFSAKTSQTAQDFTLKGNKFFKLGEFNNAISCYNLAINQDPNYAEAFNRRGKAQSRLKEYQNAIADYNKAININPNLAQAYLNRGLIRYDLGDKRGAIEDYNNTLKLNPKDAEAYNNRGLAIYELEIDKKAAINDYNKSLSINPNYAEAYVNRGNARYKIAGDKQGAIDDYNKAISLNSNLAKAYQNRGAIRYNLGDKQGAIDDLKQAAFLFQSQGQMQLYENVIKTIYSISR